MTDRPLPYSPFTGPPLVVVTDLGFAALVDPAGVGLRERVDHQRSLPPRVETPDLLGDERHRRMGERQGALERVQQHPGGVTVTVVAHQSALAKRLQMAASQTVTFTPHQTNTEGAA